MRRILYMAVVALMPMLVQAQGDIETVLDVIEHNNTTLKALRETAGAQKLENRTDIFLADPEIGFNYLWGSPSAIGNRKDISVSQSFDIATLSGEKSRVAAKKNEMIDWQYRAERMNLLLEAKQYCIDLIYYNALLKQIGIRLDNAMGLDKAMKKRLDSGDTSLPEYNNVRLSTASVKCEVARVTAERDAVVAQLARLNGGNPVELTSVDYDTVQTPAVFLEWYKIAEKKNPVLAYVRKDVELSNRQLSLSKKMGLPSFSAGYMSEKTNDEYFKGIALGVSVPLWSNRNRVRQARAAVQAAEARQVDAKLQFYGSLEVLYHRTLGLKAAADTYRASLAATDNTVLLKKAFDAGEISVADYLMQTAVYYDIVRQVLEAEREYQRSCAELYAVEL